MRFPLNPSNLLTLLRIGAAPWIGYELARANFRLALPLLVVAALSDAADGYLARRYGWQTECGEKLDPVADKVLAATLYLCLAWRGVFPWWLTGLVLGRDAFILLFAAVAMGLGRARRFPPSRWGKLSTLCQMTLASLGVIDVAWPALVPGWGLRLVMAATVAMTAWSGLHYLYLGWRVTRRAAL